MSTTRTLSLTAAGVVAGMALTGTAVAATGGSFLLGRSNTAGAATVLTATSGTALSLRTKASTTPPLAVSNGTKVANLNADRLDGLDSTALQRRVTGTCPVGKAVRAVSSTGAVTCSAASATVQDVAGTVDTTTDPTTGTTAGYGFAFCPSGYVAVGGGYEAGTKDTDPVGIARVAEVVSFTQSGTAYQLFFVDLQDTAGMPYTGGGHVNVRCVLGTQPGIAVLPAAARPAVRRAIASHLAAR